jgi:phenylalanyl-tRNA synthetase beta chain
MRASLLPSLIENLKVNLAQKCENLNIFELAPVFALKDKAPSERWWASGLMYGSGSLHDKVWNRPTEPLDLYDVKGVVESILESLGIDIDSLDVTTTTGPLFHPVRAGAFKFQATELARFAELHPHLSEELGLKEGAYFFELDMSALADIFSNIKTFTALARYPESTRDIAFVVDENIDYLKIYKSIKGFVGKVVEKVELFDVYYDKDFQKGKRSLALRVTYRSREKTLKFEEVDEVHSRVIKELESKFSAEIRV